MRPAALKFTGAGIRQGNAPQVGKSVAKAFGEPSGAFDTSAGKQQTGDVGVDIGIEKASRAGERFEQTDFGSRHMTHLLSEGL